MRMAVADVAPGVEDGNDGLALPVLMVVAHLHGARAVAKAAEIVGLEPAGAAQLGIKFAGHKRPVIREEGSAV